MKVKKKSKDNKHYAFWYRFFYNILSVTMLRNRDIFPRGGKLPEGGNLILANHVTKNDQFFISIYYGKSFIRYVSGENVFKKPILRWFIVNFMNVIIHLRGVSSHDTIKAMAKSLRRGENVMIFPSGSMTFDGRSQTIDSSIAKLTKMSACNLVLLKINGGYFYQPRWGITTRTGKTTITEHVISVEELKKVSVEAVTSAINEHLYTDAYVEQANNRIKYQGKKLCKGLECCIYECPSCQKITGLTTTDTELKCSCGFNVIYDEYGYLHTSDGTEYTITELCDNQKAHLKNKFVAAHKEHTHEFLFGDDFELTQLYRNGKRKVVGNIRVDVYSDVIEYTYDGQKGALQYNRIESVYVYMRNTLNVNLSQKDYGYELQGNFSSNALKYRDLYHMYSKLN